MPNTSTHEFNIELEEPNNQFTVQVEYIQAKNNNYEEEGTGLDALVLPSIIPFLMKSVKILPLWSGIINKFGDIH